MEYSLRIAQSQPVFRDGNGFLFCCRRVADYVLLWVGLDSVEKRLIVPEEFNPPDLGLCGRWQ